MYLDYQDRGDPIASDRWSRQGYTQVGRLSVPRSGRETTESSSHVRRLESSALATTLAKGREFSRERRRAQALSESVSFTFLSPRFFRGAGERRKAIRLRRRESLTPQLSSLFTPRVLRVYRQYRLRHPPSITMRSVTRATKIDLRCVNIL